MAPLDVHWHSQALLTFAVAKMLKNLKSIEIEETENVSC